MRAVSLPRFLSLASVLLIALASSGCPWLNQQPDYLGEKNSLLSIPDPLPDNTADLIIPETPQSVD